MQPTSQTKTNFLATTEAPTNKSPFDTIIEKLDLIIERLDTLEEKQDVIENRIIELDRDFGDGYERD